MSKQVVTILGWLNVISDILVQGRGMCVKECGLNFGVVVFIVFNNTKIDFLGGKGNCKISRMTNAC
jgi:hypothetical protein